MKSARVLLLLGPLLAGLLPLANPAAETPKPKGPKLYDEVADGSRQIAGALATARKGNKRVLLQFGANWCPWCHKLHQLFQNDKEISDRLKAHYVLVLLDVNLGHNKNLVKKYGDPTRFGLPVLVVLDATGQLLTTKNTAELEEGGDHHSPDKVRTFLEMWAPKLSVAEESRPKNPTSENPTPAKPQIPSPKERAP